MPPAFRPFIDDPPPQSLERSLPLIGASPHRTTPKQPRYRAETVRGTTLARSRCVRDVSGGLGPAERKVEFDVDRFFADVEAAGLPDGVEPRRAVAETLCVLSLRLSGGEAVDLVESLPHALAILVEPCLAGRAERPARFRRRGFLARLAHRLGVPEPAAERVARTVFAALRPRLSPTELADLVDQLPIDLRELVDAAAPGGPTRAEISARFWAEMDRRLPDQNHERRRRVVGAVLASLRARLSPREASRLLPFLPPELRDSFAPPAAPRIPLDFSAIVDDVAHAAGVPERWIAVRMTAAVLASLRRILPDEEAESLAERLPEGIAEIWRGETGETAAP